MKKQLKDRSFTAGSGWLALVALALAACGSIPRSPVERILQEGDCAAVPDIERLAIIVSDHGTKVSFQWNGTRFAGTVQTSTGTLARDASWGVNRAGEWESRFPGVSATTTVEGSFLGFPAASNPRAGILAATAYETRYPAQGEVNRAVAVVDLKSNQTALLPASRRVASIALSPDGDYVAVVETLPAASTAGWRDLFGLRSSAQSPRSDVHATVYSTGGLVACTRQLATGLPSAVVNSSWRS
jgi:hypothetical protein